MTLEKAIQILDNIRESIDEELKTNFQSTLLAQIKSYIKDFFGESSIEFEYISNFRFTPKYTAKYTNEEIIYYAKQNKEKLKDFLNKCSTTLSNKGLYKPPKSNIFSSLSDEAVAAYLIACAGFFFGCGIVFEKYNKEETTITQDTPKKTDSLLTIPLSKTTILDSTIKNDTSKASK